MIRGLQITLAVSDVARSVDFYRDQLGFDFRGYWDSEGRSVVRTWRGAERPSYAELQSGPYRVGLRASPEPAPAEAAEFTLYVEDLDEAHRRLCESGTAASPPERQAWGGRMFRFADPDGHRWSCLEVRGRGA